jgi:acetylornithine deacetylase
MKEPPTLIDTKRLHRLLKRLLDIYSPSGKEEELLDFLYKYLKRRGLPVIRQEVDEGRYNLIVSPSGKEADFAFIGHVDTVTAFDLENFGCEEDGDMIRGLGASDMKGSCAAMIEAFTCLWEQGHRDIPIAVCLVVGEEEKGDGSEELVKDYHFPWAVIGEPTDLKPCLSHHGYLEIQLTTKGDRIHASLARQGRNAIQDMLQTILKISNYLERTRPEVVFNIRDLYSSGGGFVVPDGCEAFLDLHLPPDASVADLSKEMEALMVRERQDNPTLDAEIDFCTIHSGYELPEEGPLTEALKAVYEERFLPWNPIAFPSHSDANQLWLAGVKPVIVGCGQLEKAHSPEDSISFQQVITGAEIYLQLALRFLSSNHPKNKGQ